MQKKLDIMESYKEIKYNCRRATFLIEKKQQVHLSFSEVIKLRIHLLTCSWCRLYKKQSYVISKLIKRLFKENEQTQLPMEGSRKAQLQGMIDKK